ncbi:MAG: thiolase family protein [Rhizobiaceae bacterium]|nr:thiolase family protein [Rhizobiaceae bacterium]
MTPDDRQPVIVDALRTPFGKRGGKLSGWHPVELGAYLMARLLERAGVSPADVDEVILGCVSQVGEQSLNIARNVMLAAGLPVEVPATTIDFQCGSSQQAVHLAARAIQSGAADVVVAGGVESMSRVPLGSTFSAERTPYAPELLERFAIPHQGVSAQMVADKYGVRRPEMDSFAVESHMRAAAATAAGALAGEIVPVRALDGSEMTSDEGIRANASLEAVAALKPAFDPTHAITAGNASQITDGSAMVLVMSAAKARALGLKPRARIASFLVVGCDPVTMLEGPIPATKAILGRTGLSIDDIDLFEVNEAFASIPLAWAKATGASLDRTNVNGGAIALGHPVGASGARLITTILAELERRDQRRGLVAMCCGGGLGTATIIERAVKGGERA